MMPFSGPFGTVKRNSLSNKTCRTHQHSRLTAHEAVHRSMQICLPGYPEGKNQCWYPQIVIASCNIMSSWEGLHHAV